MILIYAPGVHTGGGRELLTALLRTLSEHDLAFIDSRFPIPAATKVPIHCIRPGIRHRIAAEFAVRRSARDAHFAICFAGLPSLFRLPCKVAIFLQNQLVLDRSATSDLRLITKRLLLRVGVRRADLAIVQTSTMKALARAIGFNEVVVAPFFPPIDTSSESDPALPRVDFFYPADGYPHKNHAVLFKAWEILACWGHYPSLGVTLAPEYSKVWRVGSEAAAATGARITNFGQFSRRDAIATMRNARALIFPSSAESFGLPLLEAAAVGVPILAGELDFVRDVASPRETFDPRSSLSIAKAVCRFMGVSAPDRGSYDLSPDDWLSRISSLLADTGSRRAHQKSWAP
jgi:glycosyltransferase involved in cell wall biosynthesis